VPIFKALHILSMFTLVTLFIGGDIYYALAVQARDVRALAWVHRTELRFRIAYVALGALGVGVIFGLLTAVTGGFDVLDRWLIAAYLLVAVFVVNAQIFARATVKLAEKAVEADAGQRPVEEVVAEMAANNPARILLLVNATIFGAIILDMVLKPF
jgi:hypothetical protein